MDIESKKNSNSEFSLYMQYMHAHKFIISLTKCFKFEAKSNETYSKSLQTFIDF